MGKQAAYKIFIVKPYRRRSPERQRMILKWIPVVGMCPLRIGAVVTVHCDDCRGNCEDNRIEVPLLHSAVEPV
jgi:hypothetical protein